MCLSPVGKPANKALCSILPNVDVEAILSKGLIDYDEGDIIMHRWSSASHSFHESMLKGDRWIKVWGLPIKLWKQEYFRVIGERCGGILEADDLSSHSHPNFAPCLKVVGCDLRIILRILTLRLLGEDCMLALK